MSIDQRKKNAQAQTAPVVHGSDAAPVVYFDGVICYGLANGVVALELINRFLVPGDNGVVRQRNVVTAHLRCSIAAARDLLDCITKSIALPDPPKNEKAE